MITSIKSNNAELYKDLFAKASEVLSGYDRTQTFDIDNTYYFKTDKTFTELKFNSADDDREGRINEFANALAIYGNLYISNGKNPVDYNFSPELGVTTLEEYYYWLPEIKSKKEMDKEGKEILVPTVFTRLPLDEPYFEINANTRAISIPNEFKKNGIGVQGDDLAEVVYFMIDRYYDAMDLNNTEIFIEWETPKGKSGTVTKSVSETYLKIIDDDNYPGKLIFGWAISDAITKDSGTLKFAVRFVQWADNNNNKKELVYSFNTLTAQVTINPNLGLDLESENYTIDNCNDRLLERIEPGKVVGGAQAKVPYFLTNIVVLDDGYDLSDHKTGTYTLQVVATADDTGAVSYGWQRSEINELNVPSNTWFDISEQGMIGKFVLTSEELEKVNYDLTENAKNGYTYYICPDGENYILLDKDKLNLKENMNQDSDYVIPVIYEERGYLVVDNYGQYRAQAKNRIFNSLTKSNSQIATFKRPELVVFDNSNQTTEKHIIGDESAVLAPVIVKAPGVLDYEWRKASEDAKAILKTVSVVNFPRGGKISYGTDTIKVAFDTNTTVLTNNGSNSCVYQVNTYAPIGATKYVWSAVRGSYIEAMVPSADMWDIDPVNNSAHVGSDERGNYVMSSVTAALIVDDEWKTLYDFQSDLADGQRGNTIMIDWYDEDGNKISTYKFNIEVANYDTYEPIANYDVVLSGSTSDSAIYVVADPGYYQLHVTRTRNVATTENDSIEYRVTNAPEVPIWSNGTYDAAKSVFVTSLVAGDEVLSVNWEPTEADEFYIVWKLYREDQDKDDLTIYTQKVSGNINTHSFNPTDPIFKNVFEDNNEDYEGIYYAQVATKLNGVISNYNIVSKDPNATENDPKVMFWVSGSQD